MNIFLYFLTLFTFSSVDAKQGNRMSMFNTHHGRTIIHPRTRRARQQTQQSNSSAAIKQSVIARICTAQTCNKCMMVFTHSGNAILQAHCSRILTLKNCCPQKLLIRSGF